MDVKALQEQIYLLLERCLNKNDSLRNKAEKELNGLLHTAPR